MSAVSGVISRQVLPACGVLCFFCPAMRARSRQPVKRYKKLIADIFPRSQDGEPNDRMIGKLCEYATKNPLRIPKITISLEQRCYKELRSENVGSAKIVIYIYRKLLVSCKEQISMFANSLLSIMQTLLDQTDQDEMLIIGSHFLFDFINNQKDGTYMSNLEGFIPNLCQMAQEEGDDERAKHLRAAGLQALSAMVWFMGEYSNISIEFDDIVSGVLENYGGISEESNDPTESHWVQEVCKFEGHDCPSPEVATKVPSWRMIVNEKGKNNMTTEDSRNPYFWSRVCLHNMAKLGKEATTMRRVLESLFRYFDNTNQWPADHGIALAVLKDMQLLMDDLGHNTHSLLSILIKHLDHKNVVKQPEMQLDIVSGATFLVQLAKVHSSVAIVTTMSDVMRHLRKSIQYSLDDANLGAESIKWNRKFHEALYDCLTELSYKVGDAGPILDVMAVMLENISSITVIARSTVFAVYRTAQIVASVPNLSYKNKAFPEALFHQLLPAMVHPDHETRVGAHRIFSVVLVPSSVCPHPSSAAPESKQNIEFPRTLSRTGSVFSSSAALFEKLRNQRTSSRENLNELNNKKSVGEEEQLNNNRGMLNTIKSTYSQVNSFGSSPAPAVDSVTKSSKDMDAIPLRLSSHHITLLLSSIWAQSISPANMPENYEAIAHTYSLVLLFSQTKNSRRDALIRSFQLAFSLQSVSLAEGGPLAPSRRRSLYVLSTSMIIFASKAYSIPIVPHVKAMLSNEMVDPFLCLVKDCQLQTVDAESDRAKTMYGSEEDDYSALKCLSEMNLTEDQTRESIVSVIVKNLDNLSDVKIYLDCFEESTIQDQLLKEFKPDDVCPMGAQLFTDTPNRVHQLNSNKHKSVEKAASIIGIDDSFPDSVGSSFAHNPNLANEIPNFLSVDQLLESVLETAQEVGRLSVCTGPDASYNEMANHCESLLMGKQRKMSLINRHSLGSLSSISSRNSDEGKKQTASHVLADKEFQKGRNPTLDVPKIPRQPSINEVSMLCAAEYKHHPQPFMLPASSPYDNFLKAAGC
ncbi:unnamed protein product [Fraxinus pennsylvanica]|uniref:ARM repeat superfamily protein n=1 Tax=Fraxinus pennsylvanica TaxID=56036 RepID=A0AAD2A186_9LAMI|nr:unnamed protein product [Fraxinus pennsylvanica]